ncbi:MAG TPA: acyl-CoA dehydrogenase family protein [Actinomycetota bacterium]|jgi:alkylation response protein AidB-like acyl-CoA dehydrogenase|nr:acyl-CoA dehydrogenase family protein [Actinomycetota bacterium]
MDFRETAEQTMLREAVAKIAADYGHDYFLAKAKAGEKTTELWQAVSGAGFVGVNLPAEHGGGGMGISELAIVTEELAAHGCPLLLLMVSPAICGTLLARFGTPAQRERWLPPIASGERKMVFAITEPDAGSNTHRLETVATRDGDGWRLSGRKYYISGVDEADAVLVVSRTGAEEGAGRGRLSLFIVDTDAPGLDRAPIELHVSAPDRQFFLFLDDVRVHGDRLLGEEGDGLRQVFHGLNPERIIGAAIGNGIARYALTRAAAYAGQRQVWDVPIGAHQGLAHPLAEAKIEVELARLMTQKAAWATDTGTPGAGEAANMAKYAAAEAALHAVDTAIQVHGGNGFAFEYGIADLWWIARVLRTAPVSREMILNYVAEHSLRLPRSY